jgi:hypothetical protein
MAAAFADATTCPTCRGTGEVPTEAFKRGERADDSGKPDAARLTTRPPGEPR